MACRFERAKDLVFARQLVLKSMSFELQVRLTATGDAGRSRRGCPLASRRKATAHGVKNARRQKPAGRASFTTACGPLARQAGSRTNARRFVMTR